MPIVKGDYSDGETIIPAHTLKGTLKADGAHLSLLTTYISGTGTAGVDNTAQTVMTVAVPANTLTQVGDRLRIRTYWKGDTGTPITATMALNGVTVGDTTDSGAASFQINEAWIHYIDSTHGNIIEMEGGALGAITNVNVDGFAWASSQDITIAQDAISNNHIIVYAVIVDIFPKGF